MFVRHFLSSSSVERSSYAFSGCGWLIPFYFGAIHVLREHKLLNKHSVVAGTSGGALGSLVAAADIDPMHALEVIVETGKAREKSSMFTRDIDVLLRSRLMALLKDTGPDTMLARLNEDRNLNIVVTRIWPNPSHKPFILNQFHTLGDLVNVVAASCFIPIWSDGSLTTKIARRDIEVESSDLDGQDIRDISNASKQLTVVDGGITAFMPPVGNVRLTPFPEEFIQGAKNKPHIHMPPMKYSPIQLLAWTLTPAPEAELRSLHRMGSECAKRYLDSL